MKIVYFNYLYDLYEGALGSTIKAQRLMKALREQGAEVKEYWLNERKSDSSNSMKLSFRSQMKKRLSKYLHELSQVLSNFKYMKQERQIIRQENPDVVISRHGGYMFSTTVLSLLYRFPFILEIDSPEAFENRKFYSSCYKQLPGFVEFIEKLNFRLSKYAFVVSNVLKRYALRQGVKSRFIQVIPNAADQIVSNGVDREVEIMKEKLQISNQVVVGFVGTFHHWHGVENLIQVIDETLSGKNKEVKFLLVGGGGAKEQELKNFIRENGYQKDVILTGFVRPEEMVPYIQSMDVVLAPYPNLTFFYYSPVKIFEYLSQGKAIVASRLGQIAELIQHEKNGILCKPDDINEMVGALTDLIENDRKREKLGQQAIDDFRANHQWNVRGRKLYQFCEEVVNQNA